MTATTPTTATSAVSPVGVLVPLQKHDLSTAVGFRRWAEGRNETTARPPVVSVAEYAAMDDRARRRYDLQRAVSNANIDLISTPMVEELRLGIEDRVWANALDRSPGPVEGIMVSGGGAQGKTAAVQAICADFLDDWVDLHGLANTTSYTGARDAHEPVVYVPIPTDPTCKSLCGAILDAVGEPWFRREELGILRKRVLASLRELGVRVLLLDDITRIKMHRADDQSVLDLIRAIQDCGATLILVGVAIPGSGLLSEGRHDDDVPVTLTAQKGQLRRRAVEDEDQYTQTERRFKLLHVRNYSYHDKRSRREWIELLVALGAQLRLVGMDPETPGKLLIEGDLPEYLFGRTGGVVGTLCRLVTEACRVAARTPDPVTGEERLTRQLLDGVRANFSAEEGRVAEVGEIPDIPTVRTTATDPKRVNRVLQEKPTGHAGVG